MNLELAGRSSSSPGTDGLGLTATQLAPGCGRRVRPDEERLRASGRFRPWAATCWRNGPTCRDGDSSRSSRPRWPAGAIDGVVHNAGRASAGSIRDDDATWESDFSSSCSPPYGSPGWPSHSSGPAMVVLFTLALAAKAPGRRRAELGDGRPAWRS
jgi:hypothetical protein